MPGILLPLGLLGLLALVVPLAVHLARRSEAELLDFAAMRWLRAAPRPKSRVRFDELLLLLLRLLLVALLALMLAQPVWRAGVDGRPVVAVVPGADPVEARAAVLAAGADVRAVWLAPGFPGFGEDVPDLGPDGGQVMSFLRAFDAGLPEGAALTVVVPEVLWGVDGARPALAHDVVWRVVGGAMAAPDASHGVGGDGIGRLVVRADAGDTRLTWFSAVAAALEGGMDLQPLAADLPARRDGDVLVWLGTGALPEAVRGWLEDGGAALVMAQADPGLDAARAVVVWRDADGAIAERIGPGLVRLVRPMTAAAMPMLLAPDFPARLRALLVPPQAPSGAAAEGVLPLRGGVLMAARGADLAGWLALAIGLLWLAERWFATRPGRFA